MLYYPKNVFELNKALYGLIQAFRAWYERLSSFLTQIRFSRGKVDTTLFRKNLDNDFTIVQIYINDIIFSTTNESLKKDLSKVMQNEFKMRMMGEL